jgi:hypothetical protein
MLGASPSCWAYAGHRAQEYGPATSVKVDPNHAGWAIAIAFVGLIVVTLGDRWLQGRNRAYFRWFSAILAAGGVVYAIGTIVPDYARAVDGVKLVVAISAAAAVFYEWQRARTGRPIAERWKKFVGIALGVVAICLYFSAFKFGYPKYWHRWDQYHYYMGAKYFPEIGYDGLYKCSAIAQHQLGVVTWEEEVDEDPLPATASPLKKLQRGLAETFGAVPTKMKTRRLDMKAELEAKGKTVRKLGGDNLLIPVKELIDNPKQCIDRFSPERWEQYKKDVVFFRTTSDKKYWDDMQRDHGYNPPPVWTLAGYLIGNLSDANVRFMQGLAMIDIAYLIGVFVALWWGFGWRVAAVGAIFWGTQSSAPFYWTGGAFLRQDWLFFLVLAAALTRKRHFKLAGAAMVYAGLLRIFPGLVVVGWLTVCGAYIWRHKKIRRDHLQTIIGGCIAAAVLMGASLAVVGKDSYHKFYEHTLKVHDQTPLTNHMGLRVMVAHNVGTGKESGRMKYTKNTALVDPFETWKSMRLERYKKYRLVAYALIGATLAFFIYVVRRVRSLWIAQCLGQIWIIMLSQLTCYYYSFMILTAPLTKVNRAIEPWLFGLAAVTQTCWWFMTFNDDRYTGLTYLSFTFCVGLLVVFAPREFLTRTGLLRIGRVTPPPAPAPKKPAPAQ